MRLETVGMRLEFADTYFDTADSFVKAADTRFESADTCLEFADSSLAIDIRFADMNLIAAVGIAADTLTVADNSADNPADIVTVDTQFAGS